VTTDKQQVLVSLASVVWTWSQTEGGLYSGKPGTLWGEISSIDRGSFRFKPTQEEFNILGCIKMNEAVMLG
jgi:hypothetical protein